MRPENHLRVWIGVAIALAVVLRFHDLGHNPPGLWQDEASTGVDALRIWRTGRDRAGVFLPVISRSFGDYPLALYRYLDAPVVGVFGLSPLTERIPAAISSTLLVILTGLILFRRLGVVAAAFGLMSAAISPLWIHLARYGSEQILLPLFITLAFYLFERARDEDRRRYLWLGVVSLALAAYSYHALKVLLPLWLIGFLVYHRSTVRSWWAGHRWTLVAAPLVLILLVLPSIRAALSPEGMARAQQAAVFIGRKQGWELVRHMLDMYLFYWDPSVLFVRGVDNPVISVPGLGLHSAFDLPFLLLAPWALWRLRRTQPAVIGFGLFVSYWFLLGPAPATVGFETGSVTRIIGWFPAPSLLVGIGAHALWQSIEASGRRWPRRSFALLSGIAWTLAAGLVCHRLLVRYPEIAEANWQKEVIGSLECARQLATHGQPPPRVLVSPAFPYPETFGEFVFGPSEQGRWQPSERLTISPGELYVFPAGRPLPRGVELCAIRFHGEGEPRAFVYGPSP